MMSRSSLPKKNKKCVSKTWLTRFQDFKIYSIYKCNERHPAQNTRHTTIGQLTEHRKHRFSLHSKTIYQTSQTCVDGVKERMFRNRCLSCLQS